MAASSSTMATGEILQAGLRHVTILCSDLAGAAEWSHRIGDREAGEVAGRMLALQEIIVTRDEVGHVLQRSTDSLLVVFQTASAALNRALEIQRVLGGASEEKGDNARPLVRMGLHTGDVLIQEGERLEIISRHIHRTRALKEAAEPGQILASEAVVEAARDFIDIPQSHLAIQYYGEYYLKGAGATNLCEVADLRFRNPAPPNIPELARAEGALVGRLELAGYQVRERLGEGVHGVVYRAEENETGRAVALKVLAPALSEEVGAWQRFDQAIRTARPLRIPGLILPFQERLEHRPPFLAMELIEGRPIEEALSDAPPGRVAQAFHEICLMLDRIHQAGLVHFDLKPGNLVVRSNGSVALLDFGTALFRQPGRATLSSSSAWFSSPAYLAPELVQGASGDGRSDLYMLGVVLFKTLTGHEPFEGESVHQIIQDHLHTDPPLPAMRRPDVSDGLQRICLKALEKNPDERYPSAAEMAADLERVMRGEVVATRPTAYENLLVHRVRQHVEQIREWTQRGLLNEEEQHGLLSAYEGLQRRGLPAVMEGRVYRFWQTMVYLGGWAVINGAVLWLVLHWNELSRSGKLLLGSVPALTAFALAAGMWRLGRFRLTFVALVVGILAVPLFTGVWLRDLKVAASVPESRLSHELFHSTADSEELTNQQLLIMSLATLAAAAAAMLFTGTTTHSAQTVAALAFAYACGLLWFGFKTNVDEKQWATLALKCLPLLLAYAGIAHFLLRHPHRFYQAPPWVYSTGALFTAILLTLSLYGLEEWAGWPRTFLDPSAYLLLSLSGVVLAAAGILARDYLRHRCRPATLTEVFVGLVCLLMGLGLAGWSDTWPPTWWSPRIFAIPVSAAHLALPLVSLGITLLACRYQMFTFLLVGLAGFAISIHLLGSLYFEQTTGWPKLLIGLGATCFFAALFLELRRTRGNLVDDLVSQSRL